MTPLPALTHTRNRTAVGALLAALAFAVSAEAATATASIDARAQLVELQLARNHLQALAGVEALIASDPAANRALGLQFLRGHLLDLLGRERDAVDAWAAAMGDTPSLAPWCRYRMALAEEELGHPEVAAGLVASLVAGRAPEALVPLAVDLFRRTLAAGGDCRLLRGISPSRLPTAERREVLLARAECALRTDRSDVATEILVALLAEDSKDLVAHEAADRLVPLVGPRPTGELAANLGLAFFEHRDFVRATAFLTQAEARPPASGSRRDEVAYALARSAFWREDYRNAAARFAAIAKGAVAPETRARALYQQARSLELAGDWPGALAVLDSAIAMGTTTSSSGPVLVSALRLELRTRREAEALAHYTALAGRPAWSDHAAAAAMFLAASDLVRGRSDRAGRWLIVADRGGHRPRAELSYWHGRLAEIDDQLDAAVAAYAAALRADAYGPFGRESQLRLARPELVPVARRAGITLASSARSVDLHAAWMLLAGDPRRGEAARDALLRTLAREPAAARFLDARLVPPAEWPLWRSPAREPEELLLGLGIPVTTASVLRHFPVANPSLALTGSRLVTRVGDLRRSLLVAEILAERVPDGLAPGLLPPLFREQLYPLPWSYLIQRESRRRGVDPWLFAGLLREESRFDPLATSPATARGLAQLVLPTAARLAVAHGFGKVTPADLYRPEVAIALGAAYLGELGVHFDGQIYEIAASYNAGERQAALWRSYCVSDEAAEFLSKIGFRETRDYVARVVANREQYAEIYGRGAAAGGGAAGTGGTGGTAPP